MTTVAFDLRRLGGPPASPCAVAHTRPSTGEEDLAMENGDELRHCYACDTWLPLTAFWRGKRICRECQSEEYRKPLTLFGLRPLFRPPPVVEGKCVVAACTAIGSVHGLCPRHDVAFRRTEETPDVCIECGKPLRWVKERARGACLGCWSMLKVTGVSA